MAIAADNSTLTLSPPSTNIEHMVVRLVDYKDGAPELLTLREGYSHPSLSFGATTTSSEYSAPQLVFLQGLASANVYLEALRNLQYTNLKGRPTIGERIVTVTMYDGRTTNQVALGSYTQLTVAIDNVAPVLSVSGDEGSFFNRFFPFKGPVPAIDPNEAYVIDADSAAIERATLQLYNVRNEQEEILSVTYISPEQVSLPVIAEARDIEIPFGVLWRGERVPVITSTIPVSQVGIVGDVDVVIDIRHSWIGDLKIELEHMGRREVLALSPGGQVCQRDDLFRTTFDSDSSSSVYLSKSTLSPGECRFQSQGLFTPDGDLASFRGDPIQGNWKLIVTDLLLENDNGRLVSWSLVIQPEEIHALVYYPPVVPPLVVSQQVRNDKRHVKWIESDGRIADISVSINLGLSFNAIQLYLPTMTLVHPDGTRVRLTDSEIPLCAIGNFTYLVFKDRALAIDYSCAALLERANQHSGSGSGSSSGIGTGSGSGSGSMSGTEIEPENGTTFTLGPLPESGSGLTSGFGSSISGSGSGSAMGILPDIYMGPFYDDIINMNISIPLKRSLADLVIPNQPLSTLNGKLLRGNWTLILSTSHELESTLLGWSLRITREPNIDSSYDAAANTLTLTGTDSAENYAKVMRSVVYENVAAEPNFSIQRYIETVVYDGEAYSNVSLPTARSNITVHHIEINLDPVNLTNALHPGFQVTFREHSDPIPILDANNAVLRDKAFAVGEYILTATLKGYQNFDKEGILFNISVAPNLQAVVMNDTESQEYTVTISSATAELQPISSFESVLRTFEYYNNAEEFIGSSRIIEIQAADYQMQSYFVSYNAMVNITFRATNDLPVLVLNSYLFDQSDELSNIVSYTEGQGQLLLANASSVILTDNDHDYLESVTVMIQNPQDGLNEVLSADTTGTTISTEYDNSTFTLLLSGRDSLENYITVIGTVAYENTVHSPGMPGTEPRRITFVPFDGSHEGLPAVSLVTFTSVNDPAFGDLNGPEEGTTFVTTFTEERGPVSIISPEAMLYDVDDTNLAYIDVTILNAVDGSLEILSVMDIMERTNPKLKTVVLTNLRPTTTYKYDVGSTRLRISGLDSIREYQEVLKTLTYNNLADEPNPVTRMIDVVLNDSNSLSIPLNVSVQIQLINDSPFFDPSVLPFQPQIYEDIPLEANLGVSIFEMSYLISDDDVDASKGIAIVGIDSESGLWEYTLNETDWIPIPTNVSLNYALALESSLENRVRFVPNPDYNGIVPIDIVAWDGTDGSTSGDFINAQSRSNIDAFSNVTLIIQLIVRPVNDAPVLQETPIYLTTILEDDYNSTGDSVLSLLQYVYDVDLPEQLGVAIIGADQDNGTWEYTSDGGVTWEEFGEVNETSALLLHSLPEDLHRVRFVPDTHLNGQVSFQFLAWDLTLLPEEIPIPTPKEGSALTLSASGSGSGSGSASASGEVVVELGSSSGDSFSSGFFPEMPTVQPTMNVTEPPSPPPYPTGTRYINTTLSDPVTGPFSVNSTSALLFIEPVNDSPVITPGMSLQSIYEDTMIEMNHGTQVADIIRGFYSDVDFNPDMGLVVVGVDDRYGMWQYTCDPPIQGRWMTFIGGMYYGEVIPRLPLPEKATLLLSSCWIRFLPQPHFNTEFDTDGYRRPPTDIPYIVVHGWDNTGLTAGRSGTYGNDATYAADSHMNEFSNNSERVMIEVISINDIPILYLTNATKASFKNVYIEDGLPVAAVGAKLTLIDNDHARLRDVTITIYGSIFDQSPFSMVDFGSTFSGDYIDSMTGSGLSGSAVYSGSASGSGSGSGSDLGMDMNDTTDPPPIPYIPVISSAPNFPPLHSVIKYVENLTSPTYLDRYCAGLEPRREELLLDTSNLDVRSEVLSWCPFVLHISADPRVAFDAPVEQFQLVLRTLRYNNSLEEPEGGIRTLTFVVSDNVGLSVPANSSIFVENVDDSPQLDLNDYIIDINNFVSYTEGQGPLVLSNDSALRLIDHDNDTLQGARIVLIEAPDADYEILAANVTDTNITAFYDNTTYTLILSGNDTVEAYASVLETVTYTNSYANPGNPDERERQVHFFVSDGNSESYVAITFISFTGVNNRPHMDLNGAAPGVNYSATFVEEMGPVSIVDPNLLIHDEDNSSLAYVTVQILNPIDFGMEFLEVNEVMLREVLERNSYNRDKVIEITNLIPNMTYDVLTSKLTIRGLDSVEEFMLVLRTVTYDNLQDEPVLTCRVIEFIANDWDLDSDPVYTTLCLDPFNDSPRFNTSVEEVFSPLILEDEGDPIGVPVFIFAYELIEDDDFPPPRRGIAIVNADMENGRWEFRTSGSPVWQPIRPDISFMNAPLLQTELDEEDFVRFLPNRDFNGNASITFVAWDGSDGMSSGMHRSAISRSDTDPLSNDTRTMVLRVVPVNDAPVVDTSIQPTMTPILEDDVRERESLGDDVAIFLESLVRDVDVPDIAEHEFGIAVVGTDSGNGYWQFSTDEGGNWTNISIPITPENAIVLRSRPDGWNRIRFVPNADFYGMTSFQYKIWDQNVTYPSGTTGINTNIDPDETFSRDIATALLTVEPVNDSPVLLGDTTLSPIREDQNPSVNPGTLVSEILRNVAEDMDSPEVGVAVLYVDRRNGDWQYTCDQGSRLEWQSFFGERLSFESMFGPISQVAPLHPNEFRATLLAGDGICRIRFLPNENFNSEYNLDGSRRSADDLPFISIRTWDRTTGSNMEVGVDTTSVPDDHTNAFSREIVNATITVTSINDNPVLMLNGNFPDYPATFIEPIPPERRVIPVPIISLMGLSLVDVDNASLAFVQATFIAYDNTSESLLINTTGTSLTYSVGLELFNGEEEYSLSITPTTGSIAPIGEFESVLRTLKYQNTAEEPDPTTRFIFFTVYDGLGFNSRAPETELSIQLLNDPPQLDLGMNWPDSYTFVSYKEGEGDKNIVSENTTLVDFDNTTLESARVVIMTPPDMEHELLNASTGDTNITILLASNGSELIFLGSASVEEFLEVIKTVTYTNTFADPGDPSSMSRTIQFTVSDGKNDSLPAFVYLSFAAINNRPYLDVNGPQPGVNFTTVFREEEGPVSIVSPATVIEDIDNSSLAYIEVRMLYQCLLHYRVVHVITLLRRLVGYIAHHNILRIHVSMLYVPCIHVHIIILLT